MNCLKVGDRTVEENWTVRPVFHLDLNIGKYDIPGSLDDMLEKNVAKWEELYGANKLERTIACVLPVS